MIAGEALLWLAVASGALALVAWKLRPRLAKVAMLVHASAALTAFALLVLSFLVGDLGYRYTWAHTRPDYPAWYRLAGVWGGEEGTLLLWAAGVVVCLLLVARRAGATHQRAAAALLAFSTGLTLVAARVGSMRATSAAELGLAPQGRGLADVLLTPLMVIHPPVQFVGYALLAVPAAYAVAQWWRGDAGDRAWLGPAYRYARVAWLFATAGLGLGALWAYVVLSFGGYWAWDPVETANLLPWLALTAFLHAGKQHEKFGDHPLAAPLLAVGGSTMALFATLATRSGLWVSVHAFTDPTGSFEPDPAARLLAIVAAHEPTRLLLSVLLVALLAPLALFLLHHAPRAGAATRAYLVAHAVLLLGLAGAAAADVSFLLGAVFEVSRLVGDVAWGFAATGALLLALPLVVVFLEQDDRHRRFALDARTVMSAGVALLALALAVAFLLNLQVVNGPDRRVFDVRAPWVALPIVSTITLAMALPALGRARSATLALAGLAAGAAAWALMPSHRVLALSAPVLLAGIVAVATRLAHSQGQAAPLRLRLAGGLLVAGSALGFVVWSNPPTDALGLRIPSSWGWWLAALGLAASTVGLAGSVALFRARSPRVALAGCVAAGATLVGLPFALAALALAGSARASLRPAPEGFLRAEAVRLRELGIYAIHLAVMLGLLGYAASTYSQEREVFAAAPVGTTVAVGDYTIAIGEGLIDARDGRLDAARIPLRLVRDDGELGATLAFAWRGPPSSHYAPDLDIRRTLTEDVYVSPLAFHTADGWVGATSAAAQRVPASEVDAVTFSVAVLPLVGLVWTGLWMGLAGMGLVLLGSAYARRGATPERAAS